MARVDKGGGDFATAADVEAEDAMRAVLRARRPGDAVLGEESGRSGAGDGSRIWLLDPLCGTLNYAAGMSVVAVNAALVEAGEPSVAAVADPFAGEIFWTDGQSVSARRGAHDAAVRPSAATRLVDLNLDPPFPNGSKFRAVTLAADDEFTASFRPCGVQFARADLGRVRSASRVRNRRRCSQHRSLCGWHRDLQSRRLQHFRSFRRRTRGQPGGAARRCRRTDPRGAHSPCRKAGALADRDGGGVAAPP